MAHILLYFKGVRSDPSPRRAFVYALFYAVVFVFRRCITAHMRLYFLRRRASRTRSTIRPVSSESVCLFTVLQRRFFRRCITAHMRLYRFAHEQLRTRSTRLFLRLRSVCLCTILHRRLFFWVVFFKKDRKDFRSLATKLSCSCFFSYEVNLQKK